MAISFERTRFGDMKTKHDARIVGKLTFDSSYPTGGESVSGIDPRIDELVLIPGIQFISTTGYYFGYDRTNRKLKAYTLADGAEVANATDLSGIADVDFIAKIWVE